ncbi:MAG: DeoR family transcriptional regulator [Alloprevotella sp.]
MSLQLTERQKQICKLLLKDSCMSTTAMSEVLSVTTRTIKRDLASLQEKGVLIREGNAKSGHWMMRHINDN